MHGTIFLLSETDRTLDKILLERCRNEAFRFFGDIFDYIDDMVIRDPGEEGDRFLDDAKEYAVVEERRVTFTIRDLYKHDFGALGYPVRTGRIYVDYFIYLDWLSRNRYSLIPVVLIDSHDGLSMGYSLLDAVLQPLYSDILSGRFPDAMQTHSYYLAGAFDYHY